jgi:molybdate transport system substrate-binding protein
MFAPVSEIETVAGVEVLGRFPEEFQRPVVMTAGVAADATDADGARKLIAFLTSKKAAAAMLATGMEPADAQ